MEDRVGQKIGCTLVKGIGNRTWKKWLTELSLSDCYTLPEKLLRQRLGNGKLVTRWLQERTSALEKAKQIQSKTAAQMVWFQDPDYPARLAQCPDAPLLFYYLGAPCWNHSKVVAVVGTRTPDQQGLNLTRKLIQFLHTHNVLVVSGMAYGIDYEAHQTANAINMQNIAVLGSALNQPYPYQHRGEIKKTENRGAVISEFPWGTKPDRENFPQRNRIIAGLADLTIVVQSKAKGGALITAELAQDYNREVGCFPGDIGNPNFSGNNKFIYATKAFCIHELDSIIEQMGWSTSGQQLQLNWSPPPFPDRFCYLKNFIDPSGTHIDILCCKTGRPASAIQQDLFYLELENFVRIGPGNIVHLV